MRPDTAHSYRPEMPPFCKIGFGVSMVLHFLAIAAIIFLPDGLFRTNRFERPPSFDVKLVSLNPELPPAPGGTGAPASSKKKAKTSPPVEKAEPVKAKPAPVEPVPEPDAIPIKISKEKKTNPTEQAKAPEPVVKKSLKKKTFKPDKVIEAAVKQIEDKYDDNERPDSVQKRIDQMQSDAGSNAPDVEVTGRTGNTPGSGGFSSGGVAGGSYTQMQIYQAEVAGRIKQNWAFSPELAGNTDGMESRVVIKIMPDGRITDVWYEKRSGNSYLDESAYRTVMKSNPLPPLPEGNSYYHLVLGFTPSGLQ